MASSAYYAGMGLGRGRWFSGLKRGGVETYPFEFRVDPALPSQGQELPYPSNDYVVIPRGRIVAAKATSLTKVDDHGETLLTLANGIDPLNAPEWATGANAGNLPIGYAMFNYMRSMYGRPSDAPVVGNLHSIEVPYTSINESYNNNNNGGSRLLCGELVMPYFGSAVSTTPTNVHKGKLVRYVPKTVYLGTHVASATVALTAAVFPAFPPRILQAFNNTGALITSGGTLSYNAGQGVWTATFGTPITSTVYEYGAPISQVIGRIIGIEPVGTAGGINATSHEMAGWLRWVTDNFGLWDMPPIMKKVPTTSVTLERVTLTDNEGLLANSPVNPWTTISVFVTGSILNNDGTTTSIHGVEMALADEVTFTDYSRGQYYDIDIMTGRIRFAQNVTVTTVDVSYSYDTDFKDGLRWDSGITGLTDGFASGIVGLPPHLEVAGVFGALRVAIFGD